MKKVLIYLLALAMAMTSVISLIPASANVTQEAEKAVNLLAEAETNFGDPDVLDEDDLNGRNWVGHENWNNYQGWSGFSASTGNGDAPYVTREVYETTKSDGTTGNVLRIANDTEGNVGSETAIENIDKICNFQDGTSYTAKVVVKVVNAAFNGHKMIVSWSSKGCTHDGSTESTVLVPQDNQWHTIYATYTYSSEGNGEYLYIAPCENWINAGAEFYIESVEVYETSAYVAEYGYLGDNGTFDTASVVDNSGDSILNTWAGWVNYTASGATSSHREVVTTTLSDGTEGKAMHIQVEGTEGYGAYNTNLKIGYIKPSTRYRLKVVAKFTGNYSSSGKAVGVWANGIGASVEIPGDSEYGNCFLQSNDGEWAITIVDFTTPETISGDGAIVKVGAILGDQYAAPCELYVESVELEERENLLENADLANDLSNGWTKGWGNGGEEGYDATVSHTADGTGSMYICNTESAARHISQTLNLVSGHTYVIGGWVKTDETYEGGTLNIDLGGDSSPFQLGGFNSGANDWTNVEIVYTPEQDMATTFQVRLWGTVGKAYFDDLYVYDVTETPVTYTDICESTVSKTWSKGWSGGVSQGYDEESHTADGSGSIKLVTCASNGEGGLKNCNQHYTRKVYLVAGVKYSVSGWIKVSDTFRCTKNGATGAFISLTSSTGTWPCTAGYVDTNDVSLDWKYFVTTYEPATSGEYFLSCCAWGNDYLNSTVYFDEICVTPYENGATDSPFYMEEAALDTQPTVEGNLLSNAEFESDITTGWTAGWKNGIAQEWSSLVSHTNDGTGSVRLVNAANGNQHCAQNVTLAAKTGYKLSGWIKVSSDYKTSGAGGTGAWIGFNDNIGFICGISGDNSDTDWIYFEGFYYNDSDEDVQVPVTLRLWGSGGSAWFDELALVVCSHDNTELRNDVEADCGTATDGYTGDTYCEDCGALIETGEVIPAEHTDENQDNICDICQQTINQGTSDKALFAIVAFVVVLAAAVIIKRRVRS